MMSKSIIISLYLRMVAFAGSNLPLPSNFPEIPAWNSGGLKFTKKKLKILEALNKLFLDTLEIGGDVRGVLNKMFDENKMTFTPTEFFENGRSKTSSCIWYCNECIDEKR